MRVHFIHRRLIILTLVIICQCCTGCMDSGKENNNSFSGIKETYSNEKGPLILFEKTVHDFGNMRPLSTNTAVYKFINAGNGVLHILDVKGCCGTKVGVSKGNFDPGQEGAVVAEYKTGSWPYDYKKNIHLYTDSIEDPKIVLTARGKVIETLSWHPQMLEFKVYKNKVLTPKLTIKSLDGELFKIKSIRSALGCVSGIYDPDKFVKEAIIEFRLNLENAKMLFNPKGTLTVELEHADFKEIMIEYCVRPPLSITPSQITEFSVEHKKPFIRTVALRKEANIDSSLEIISLEIDTVTAIGDSGVNIKRAEQTEEGCDITLEIFPPSPGKNKNSKYETDQLVIWFKDGNKVAIPIRYMFK